MNLVPCSENCRWQSDGMCTLKDLTRPANSAGSECPILRENGYPALRKKHGSRNPAYRLT